MRENIIPRIPWAMILVFIAMCFFSVAAHADPLSDAQKLEGDLRACETLLDEQVDLNEAQNGCCKDLKSCDALKAKVATLEATESELNIKTAGLFGQSAWFQALDPNKQFMIRGAIYVGTALLAVVSTMAVAQ